MSLPLITPQQANALIDDGAKLIDIRDPDEYAREHIPVAQSVPLDTLPGALNAGAGETVIFHCQSGARTSNNAARLAQRRRLLRPRGRGRYSGLETGRTADRRR